jgi:hypothetical protein
MVAWKGDFITREKFESMSQKAEGG